MEENKPLDYYIFPRLLREYKKFTVNGENRVEFRMTTYVRFKRGDTYFLTLFKENFVVSEDDKNYEDSIAYHTQSFYQRIYVATYLHEVTDIGLQRGCEIIDKDQKDEKERLLNLTIQTYGLYD
jgi:hypothetical protein